MKNIYTSFYWLGLFSKASSWETYSSYDEITQESTVRFLTKSIKPHKMKYGEENDI